MSFCTKCGNQNSDTSKFCTRCGITILPKVANPSPVSYEEKIPEKIKNNKSIIWLLTGIFSVGAALAAYFIIFKKKKEENIPLTETPIKNNNQPIVDTTTVVTYENSVSPPVPLQPSTNSTELTMTETEVKSVSQQLENFYQCENNEDINCLLSNYSFPVNQYYQFYTVSYDNLHKLFTESFNDKLTYHNITIKWNSSSLQKLHNGYKAILYADYEFRRANSPDELRNRSIQIILYMDWNYKITSIYENQ